MNQSDFKEGNHDSFIQFLYSSEPKEKGSIQLELPCSEENKSQELHIFEQLLMIFVDGLKYFYGDENKRVNVENLQEIKISRFRDLHYTVAKDPKQLRRIQSGDLPPGRGLSVRVTFWGYCL